MDERMIRVGLGCGLLGLLLAIAPAGRAQDAGASGAPGDDAGSAGAGEAVEGEAGETGDDAAEALADEPPAPPALIPRQVLFGNPDRAQARVSPDGTHISYLAPVDGVLNVWVGPADDVEAAQPITADTGRGIRSHGWAHTGEHLFYVQDRDGDENWHLYRIELATGDVLDLTPIDGVKATVVGASPKHPRTILVGINDRKPQLHDVWRVDVVTGERERVLKNKGYAGFHVDSDLQIRLADKMTADGGGDLYVHKGKGRFKKLLHIDQVDSMTTSVIGFDASGEGVYLRDSRGRDTAALMYMRLDDQRTTMLLENPNADVGAVVLHPTEHVPLLASVTYERTRIHVLDERFADDVAYLQTVEDGELFLAGCDDTLARCVVGYELDVDGVRYYLYDRGARSAELLFSARPALADYPLAPMHPAVIPARDGLPLVSYYTLPLDADVDGDARPEQPLPLVLFVHGGPWGRDSWGYRPVHQWIANRGAAVLSVNFRGSTGFGKAFVNAGDREWAAKMHDDLLDAVQWAVDQGIADPDQVAIAGGSYGGYATLVGLTFTPEVFAAGVDIVGPSNLVTLLQSIPPYWAPIRQMFKARVGDVDTAEGRAFLTERSPLSRADAIVRPLLIAQGANDPRVKQAESDQIVAAMKAKELPVTYVLYPDEGHGFARPQNTISFFAVAEAFLSQHLGTRFEPVGADFEGASLQVLEGAEQVPGLADALRTD